MEPVSAVLAERAADRGGLGRTLGVSVGAHVVFVAAIILLPILNGSGEEVVRPVMTISLGGAPGPSAGGANMMASPPPPKEPPAETPRPEPVRPPAPKPPAMTLPAKTTRPARTPPKAAPKSAPRPAPAPAKPAAESGASLNRGTGFGGLSTGGGGGTGSYLEVENFCCPDYVVTMLQLIQRNWNSRQEVAGRALVMFRIRRDGRITDIELERSSGYAALDLTAQRALFLTQRLPPLPSAFPNDELTVHLRFDYER
ncbi:MAG: energy transducer TonB [Acidobacteriota bacterium]